MAKPPAQQDIEKGQPASANGKNAAASPGGTSSAATTENSKQQLYHDLIKAAQKELLYTSNGDTTLNLATLQRLLLFHLRVEIINQVGPLKRRELSQSNPLDGLKKTMAEYAQAVRDWELMAAYQEKSGGDPSRDPFCISKGDLIVQALNIAKLTGDGDYEFPSLETKAGPFGQRNRMNKDRRLKAFLLRFAAAIFGGMTLIGPMLLMVLHKDKTTDLSTTSAAVFLFAIIVAWKSDAAPETIVSVVAAYAAVLVVFVGTLQ